MVLRAVFFDLDDTLCDSIGTRSERARKAFEPIVAKHPETNMNWLLSRALEPLDEPRSVRGVAAILDELELAETPTGRAALRMYVGYHEPLSLFPDVEETLRVLGDDYLLGIISNAESWYQRSKLTHLGIAKYFQCIVISDEVGHRKPDSRIFEHALRLARVQPHEALFVGDRLDVDVEGARAAGMHTVWFNHWGGTLPIEMTQPQLTIERFVDLVSAIKAVSD